MYYTIYKTTNLINGKFYIGKHKTKDLDDGYMGSGKILKHAISKYGLDNFHKEILHVCESEKQMNALEKILVVPDPEINYNLCEGGKGGFGYINANNMAGKPFKNLSFAKQAGIKSSQKLRKRFEDADFYAFWKHSTENKRPSFKGRKHTDSWKQNHSHIMKKKTKGSGNSQYGTCWITNGLENKKIKKEELDLWLELGYNKGRIIKGPLV